MLVTTFSLKHTDWVTDDKLTVMVVLDYFSAGGTRTPIGLTSKDNKQMFVKHLPPARSEYRVPQRPITKTGTKEGQLTQRYY